MNNLFMNIFVGFFLSIVLMTFGIVLHAQERVYESNGFMIETRGNYVFQPCNDSSISVLSSLTKGSFRLPLLDPHNDIITPYDLGSMWQNAKRIYCGLKYNSCNGDSVLVDSLIYYYCRIKITIPNYGNVENNLCFSEIVVNGRIYKFNGLSFPNSLIEFEPLREIDRRNFNHSVRKE